MQLWFLKHNSARGTGEQQLHSIYLRCLQLASFILWARAARPGVHVPTFLSLNYIIFCYPSSRSSFCSVLCQSFYICSISNPLEYFTRYSRSDCTLILPLSKLQVIAPFSGNTKIFLVLAGDLGCLTLQENHALSSEHPLWPANPSATPSGVSACSARIFSRSIS